VSLALRFAILAVLLWAEIALDPLEQLVLLA